MSNFLGVPPLLGLGLLVGELNDLTLGLASQQLIQGWAHDPVVVRAVNGMIGELCSKELTLPKETSGLCPWLWGGDLKALEMSGR